MTQAPDASNVYLSGDFPETRYLSDGEAAATCAADESSGYRRPGFQAQEGSSYLSLSVEVEVEVEIDVDGDGDELVVSFDP